MTHFEPIELELRAEVHGQLQAIADHYLAQVIEEDTWAYVGVG